MTATWYFNRELVKDMIRTAMEDAVDETADHVAAEARRRAPIRKVFKERTGYRPKLRALTDAEKSLAIARAEHYYTQVKPNDFKRRRAVAHIKFYAQVASQRPGSANALSRSRDLRHLGNIKGGKFTSQTGATRNYSSNQKQAGFNPGPEAAAAMTSAGLGGVRSGRAIHYEASAGGAHKRVQVGGALKASIENEGVVEVENGVKATVAANIRYAKFVEFPTVRTRAQPFLLPALQQEREAFKSRLASEIRKNLGG
jgi:HK97 gp10 family phage protein